ncbi:MAG: glycosyltransferase family 2 protein, partial [Verrucomicrobiota bacterium]|nr:glycosyltransferase family 2 protein [Verrucomicrobiota bacterium]
MHEATRRREREMYPMPTQSAPLVSIIIAAYVTTPHQAQLLGETLHTVAAQTFQGFEIIVVDDGSPLNVRAVTAGHARTRTLRQENAGPAMARNTGIRASRGKHIVFLDGDDHLLPEGLEAGLCALAAHPECGFAVGGREEMTYEGNPVSWRVATLQGQTQLYHSLLGFDCYIIPPSSVMFRRRVVETIGDW